MLASKTKRAIQGGDPVKEHLLITRYNTQRVHSGEMLSLDDIQDILRIKLLGVIPESETVLQSSNQRARRAHERLGRLRGLQGHGGALGEENRCAS